MSRTLTVCAPAVVDALRTTADAALGRRDDRGAAAGPESLSRVSACWPSGIGARPHSPLDAPFDDPDGVRS